MDRVEVLKHLKRWRNRWVKDMAEHPERGVDYDLALGVMARAIELLGGEEFEAKSEIGYRSSNTGA